MAGVFEINNGVLKVDALVNEDTYHYIEFGRAGHNAMNIYEYGGALALYQTQSTTPVSIMRVSPSEFTYKENTVITSSNIGSYNSWGSKNLFFFGVAEMLQ